MNPVEHKTMVDGMVAALRVQEDKVQTMRVLKENLVVGRTSVDDTVIALLSALIDSHEEGCAAGREQIRQLKEALKP